MARNLPPPLNAFLRFFQGGLPAGDTPVLVGVSLGAKIDTTQYVIGSATIVASPSSFSVAETASIGTTVASLTASNGGSLSGLSLSGANSTDFQISGTSLQVAATLNHATKPSYTLFINGAINGNSAPQLTVFGTVTAIASTSVLLLANGTSFFLLANGMDELLLAGPP